MQSAVHAKLDHFPQPRPILLKNTGQRSLIPGGHSLQLPTGFTAIFLHKHAHRRTTAYGDALYTSSFPKSFRASPVRRRNKFFK